MWNSHPPRARAAAKAMSYDTASSRSPCTTSAETLLPRSARRAEVQFKSPCCVGSAALLVTTRESKVGTWRSVARELKARLSEYLERAAPGEHLTITDRGRPRAILGPLPGGDNIARGIAEGVDHGSAGAGTPAVAACAASRLGLRPRYAR